VTRFNSLPELIPPAPSANIFQVFFSQLKSSSSTILNDRIHIYNKWLERKATLTNNNTSQLCDNAITIKTIHGLNIAFDYANHQQTKSRP
jgi:hypothetical protein